MGVADVARVIEVLFQFLAETFLPQQAVYIGFFEVCNEQGALYGGLFQVQPVGFQYPCRIFLGVCIAQEEQETFWGCSGLQPACLSRLSGGNACCSRCR